MHPRRHGTTREILTHEKNRNAVPGEAKEDWRPHARPVPVPNPVPRRRRLHGNPSSQQSHHEPRATTNHEPRITKTGRRRAADSPACLPLGLPPLPIQSSCRRFLFEHKNHHRSSRANTEPQSSQQIARPPTPARTHTQENKLARARARSLPSFPFSPAPCSRFRPREQGLAARVRA